MFSKKQDDYCNLSFDSLEESNLKLKIIYQFSVKKNKNNRLKLKILYYILQLLTLKTVFSSKKNHKITKNYLNIFSFYLDEENNYELEWNKCKFNKIYANSLAINTIYESIIKHKYRP